METSIADYCVVTAAGHTPPERTAIDFTIGIFNLTGEFTGLDPSLIVYNFICKRSVKDRSFRINPNPSSKRSFADRAAIHHIHITRYCNTRIQRAFNANIVAALLSIMIIHTSRNAAALHVKSSLVVHSTTAGNAADIYAVCNVAVVTHRKRACIVDSASSAALAVRNSAAATHGKRAVFGHIHTAATAASGKTLRNTRAATHLKFSPRAHIHSTVAVFICYAAPDLAAVHNKLAAVRHVHTAAIISGPASYDLSLLHDEGAAVRHIDAAAVNIAIRKVCASARDEPSGKPSIPVYIVLPVSVIIFPEGVYSTAVTAVC